MKSPETEAVEKKEDIDGAILEKAYLYQAVVEIMEKLELNG